MNKENSKQKKYLENDECIDNKMLIKFSEEPSSLEKNQILSIQEHLKDCQICNEDLAFIKESLEKTIESEPEMGMVENLLRDLNSDKAISEIPQYLKDISNRYPGPFLRKLDLSKIKKLLQILYEKGQSLSDLIAFPCLSICELSPVAIRSVAQDASLDEEELIDLLKSAKDADSDNNFKIAGEIYQKMAEKISKPSLKREFRALAARSFLRSKLFDHALANIIETIYENTTAEHYLILVHILLEMGELEHALKYLQIIESLDEPVSKDAQKILDEIEKL